MAVPIVPSDLGPAATVTGAAALVVDDGVNVQKATPLQVVDAARPLASQAEAEAGTDNVKLVSSLRVAQAIAALGVSNGSLVAGLATKENLITAGTSAQYWRGDKTFQTLNKAVVGLANVDNTTDAAKPVSTATQTALNLKMTSATLAATGGAALVGTTAGNVQSDINTINANVALRPTSTTLAASGGAALIGSAAGNVQTDINARPTSATLALSTGSGLIGWIQLGVGAVLRNLLDWLRERPISVKDFGATGNGSTDDTAAVQAWVTYLSTNGRMGYVPKGNYKLTSTVTAPQANNWGWRGEGKYKSAFFWAGASTTSDIFALGGTGADSRGCLFESFSVFSFSAQTAGTAFKLTNFTDPSIDDVTFGGELYAKNTWHGIWFNGCHEAKLTRFDIMGLGDGIIVNSGTLGNSSNSDLYLDVGFANNCGGAGIRCAGGFGGLNVGQVQLLGNMAGQLVVDNSIAAASNREIILSANFVADGVLATQDNIILNSPTSSTANLICAGTIGSATRYGVNVISWPSGFLNFSAGRIYNNVSDAIHMTDATVTLVCGSGLSIDTNGGLGVYSSVTNTLADISCAFAGNVAGDIGNTIGNWKQSFTPTVTSGSGSFTSASATMRYQKRGKNISFRALVAITTNGTAAGSANITMPFSAAATSVATGIAASVSGKGLTGFISGSNMVIRNYDGTFPGANGENLVVEGVYEAV